jgi:hypothetical protein
VGREEDEGDQRRVEMVYRSIEKCSASCSGYVRLWNSDRGRIEEVVDWSAEVLLIRFLGAPHLWLEPCPSYVDYQYVGMSIVSSCTVTENGLSLSGSCLRLKCSWVVAGMLLGSSPDRFRYCMGSIPRPSPRTGARIMAPDLHG